MAQFFSTISMIAFWFSGVLLVLYLFHVIYVLSKVPWTKIEFFFCVGAALLLGLTSALIIGQGAGFLIAAGVSIHKNKFDDKFYSSLSNYRELLREKVIIFLFLFYFSSFSVLWRCVRMDMMHF